MAVDPIVQINTQKIPVGGGVGAAILIAIVLGGMFADLPGVRATVVWGGAIGLVLGLALIGCRRLTVGSDIPPTLGITGRSREVPRSRERGPSLNAVDY